MVTSILVLIVKCLYNIYKSFIYFLFCLDEVSLEVQIKWFLFILLLMVGIRIISVILLPDKFVEVQYGFGVLILSYILLMYVCMSELNYYNSRLLLPHDYIFFHSTECIHPSENSLFSNLGGEEVEEDNSEPAEISDDTIYLIGILLILFTVPPGYIIVTALFYDDVPPEKPPSDPITELMSMLRRLVPFTVV